MGEIRRIPHRGAARGASRERLRFGSFEVDLNAGELRKGGLKIKLHAQSLTVLAMLLERPGEVVTREELQQRLWASETFVDFESGLNKAVNKLREALGDEAGSPRYVETLPRRGYRFLAPLTVIAPAPPFPALGSSPFARAGPQALPSDAAGVRAWAPWRRWLLVAGAGAVAVAVLIVALNLGELRNRLLTRQSAPTLDPKRVVVAPFENRTGDPSLDNLGRMAADAVNGGLQQVNTLQVVSSSTVFETAAGKKASRGRDPLRELAVATSAGLLVSGAFYQQSHMLQIRATIMDEVASKPLYVVAPVNGTRDKAVEAVGVVAQRATDTVAARYLNPDVDLLVEEAKPPAFEAQIEALTAYKLFYSDPSAAIVHVRRALEIDPDFMLARYILAYSTNNSGQPGEAMAQLDAIERSQMPLSPLMRRRVAWLRASISGRLEEVYSIACEIAKLVPEEPKSAIDVAVGAGWTNRPRAAVATFKTLRGPPYFEPSHTLGVDFLWLWTTSLHLLGDHEEELKEARWGRELYPHLLNLHAYEARALVALGRLGEVDRLIDEILAVSSTWSYSHCCLPHATPAYVMLSAAEELHAHGHHEAALKMAGRAVDWYRSRVGEEARQEDTRSGLGDALYLAERWEESTRGFGVLSAQHPSNIFYLGRLGALAARRGDRARALQIAEKLQRDETPYLHGLHTVSSAQIFALLGDKERALALLREAVAQGWVSCAYSYSHSMDLESLQGYPPFEELIKPKD
jgi:DNA-binding winged helix-turn-helix (wHTH) protein/TolB-like protein